MLLTFSTRFSVSIIAPLLKPWSFKYVIFSNPYLTSSIIYSTCMISTLITCLVFLFRKFKFHIWILLSVTTLFYLISSLLIVLEENLYTILLCRIFQGIGSALSIITSMYILGELFYFSKISRIYSIYNFSLGLGLILGNLITIFYTLLKNLLFLIPLTLQFLILVMIFYIKSYLGNIIIAKFEVIEKVHVKGIYLLIITYLAIGYFAIFASFYPVYAEYIDFHLYNVSITLMFLCIGFTGIQLFIRKISAKKLEVPVIPIIIIETLLLIITFITKIPYLHMLNAFIIGLCTGYLLTFVMSYSYSKDLRIVKPELYTFTLYLSMSTLPLIIGLLIKLLNLSITYVMSIVITPLVLLCIILRFLR